MWEAGRLLVVPGAPATAAASSRPAAVNKAASTHVVRPGETLSGIAEALWRAGQQAGVAQRHLQPRQGGGRAPAWALRSPAAAAKPAPARPATPQATQAKPATPAPAATTAAAPATAATTTPATTAAATTAAAGGPPGLAHLWPYPGGFHHLAAPGRQPGRVRRSITRASSCFWR